MSEQEDAAALTKSDAAWTSVLRTLSDSQSATGSVYLGRSFCEANGWSPGDKIAVSYAELGSSYEGKLTGSWTLGGQTQAFRRLELSSGARVQINRTDDGLALSVHAGRDEGPNTEARDATSDHLRLRLAQLTEDGSVTVYGVGTGFAGERGGLNTANDLLLEAIKQPNEKIRVKRVLFGYAVVDSPPDSDDQIDTITYAQMMSDLATATPSIDRLTVVVGHGHPTGFAAAQAVSAARALHKSSAGIKHIHFAHTAPTQIAAARGGAHEGSRSLSKIANETALLRRADAAVFAGNAASDYPRLAQMEAAEAGNIAIPDFLFPVPEKHEAVSAPRDPYVRVLAFGRLDDADVKGLDVALEAIKRLEQFKTHDHRRVQLQLVGQDSSALTTRIGAVPVVEMPYCAQSQIGDMIDGASLVILPSAADALGLAALEALARGRGCLVSDAAGVSGAFRRNSAHTWVVPAGDPDQWAAAIRSCLDSAPDDLQEKALRLSSAINAEAAASVDALRNAIQQWIDEIGSPPST